MKHIKIRILLIFCIAFFINLSANAEISIGLPLDFIYEITRGFGFGEDLSFVQKLLTNRIANFKPNNLSRRVLINYLLRNDNFIKISSNKLLETKTNATFEFERCRKNECKVLIDLNGKKLPNEQWVDISYPKDIITLTLKKSKNGDMEIILPEFWR